LKAYTKVESIALAPKHLTRCCTKYVELQCDTASRRESATRDCPDLTHPFGFAIKFAGRSPSDGKVYVSRIHCGASRTRQGVTPVTSIAPVTLLWKQEMETGTVKWFNDAKGYGFITPDGGGEDLFAHFSEVRVDGFKSLQENQKVTFETKAGPKGKQAANIKPA
jgi:cold shock protein